MSHTTDLTDGWYAIHDGDIRNSCDIVLINNDKKIEVEIPFFCF